MFNGVRRSYTLLALLLMEVIEELGTDRALEMLQRATEGQAEVVHRKLGKEMEPDLPPLEKGVEVYRRFMEEAGAEVQVQNLEGNSATFLVRRCPFYEAFLDIGIDCGYFLGGLCTQITLPAVQATLMRFDPRLTLETTLVRESAEEYCLERVYLREG
jgi:predicted ArsR family transcriptional regulator